VKISYQCKYIHHHEVLQQCEYKLLKGPVVRKIAGREPERVETWRYNFKPKTVE
jgi:hypothetical protein